LVNDIVLGANDSSGLAIKIDADVDILVIGMKRAICYRSTDIFFGLPEIRAPGTTG
jgi:hypothetical protein